MKRITLKLMILLLSLSVLPNVALANNAEPVAAPVKTVPAEVQAMYDRLATIKEMDKSEMSSAEKKELRKEVKVIKSELKRTGNGVYLSVGAIIIIILLLILLL